MSLGCERYINKVIIIIIKEGWACEWTLTAFDSIKVHNITFEWDPYKFKSLNILNSIQ